MMRTQPPGFRWLVGGFALVAAVAFGFRYLSAADPMDLLFGALCLVAAGYWLIIDREPPADGQVENVSHVGNLSGDEDPGHGPGHD
ncbi:hypothetical protein [Jatrophihabitans sp.]|jgi:hypothetical protein|uniref:hypothetical protein n=1 Tax=Jatrophihabitans sp. TaxID=1932789 RepID=UPI002EF3B6DC